MPNPLSVIAVIQGDIAVLREQMAVLDIEKIVLGQCEARLQVRIAASVVKRAVIDKSQAALQQKIDELVAILERADALENTPTAPPLAGDDRHLAAPEPGPAPDHGRTLDLSLKGAKGAFMFDVVLSFGPDGATCTEIARRCAERGFEISTNWISSSLSSQRKRGLITKSGKRHIAVPGAEPQFHRTVQNIRKPNRNGRRMGDIKRAIVDLVGSRHDAGITRIDAITEVGKRLPTAAMKSVKIEIQKLITSSVIRERAPKVAPFDPDHYVLTATEASYAQQ